MAVNSVRDLRVWQLGMDLVEHVYDVTCAFPRHELYGLTSQMRRAAISVPSNIAEGHTRAHTRAYLQHVSMAMGSLAALQTQLEIAARLKYAPPARFAPILTQATVLARQLYALRNALTRDNSHQSLPPNPNPPSPNRTE